MTQLSILSKKVEYVEQSIEHNVHGYKRVHRAHFRGVAGRPCGPSEKARLAADTGYK